MLTTRLILNYIIELFPSLFLVSGIHVCSVSGDSVFLTERGGFYVSRGGRRVCVCVCVCACECVCVWGGSVVGGTLRVACRFH